VWVIWALPSTVVSAKSCRSTRAGGASFCDAMARREAAGTGERLPPTFVQQACSHLRSACACQRSPWSTSWKVAGTKIAQRPVARHRFTSLAMKVVASSEAEAQLPAALASLASTERICVRLRAQQRAVGPRRARLRQPRGGVGTAALAVCAPRGAARAALRLISFAPRFRWGSADRSARTERALPPRGCALE
jgi:hypothetical protein